MTSQTLIAIGKNVDLKSHLKYIYVYKKNYFLHAETIYYRLFSACK